MAPRDTPLPKSIIWFYRDYMHAEVSKHEPRVQFWSLPSLYNTSFSNNYLWFKVRTDEEGPEIGQNSYMA